MTVGELIKQLSTYPEDMPVAYEVEYDERFIEISTIKTVYGKNVGYSSEYNKCSKTAKNKIQIVVPN